MCTGVVSAKGQGNIRERSGKGQVSIGSFFVKSVIGVSYRTLYCNLLLTQEINYLLNGGRI
jgi:hypothetical protein